MAKLSLTFRLRVQKFQRSLGTGCPVTNLNMEINTFYNLSCSILCVDCYPAATNVTLDFI